MNIAAFWGHFVVKKKKNRRITISLDQTTFENISRVASENNISMAWVIRYAVDNLLGQQEEGQQLLLPLAIEKRP